MPLPTVVGSIVGWLRAGYPDGVPEHDYIPLFALLSRRLTDDEVAAIAAELGGTSPATATAIREAISTITSQPPLDADVARVSARLAAGGWPLSTPER